VSSGLVCARRFASPIEANIVRGLIEGAGIAVQLDGESLVGAYAGVPKVGDVRLMVREADLDAVGRILEAYEQRESEPEWTCQACGETNGGRFEVCWQCGAAAAPGASADGA
jgi:hypothetical protein